MEKALPNKHLLVFNLASKSHNKSNSGKGGGGGGGGGGVYLELDRGLHRESR